MRRSGPAFASSRFHGHPQRRRAKCKRTRENQANQSATDEFARLALASDGNIIRLVPTAPMAIDASNPSVLIDGALALI